MSITAFILGHSGTGKSTSMRNLDPAKSLLIKVIDKPLPFKSKNWTLKNKDGGNVFVTDHYGHIIAAMQKTTDDIIVIDDYQYLLANELMRRSAERGYDKFTDIADHAWRVIDEANRLPPNKRVYILSHIATDDFGKEKIKTIGKMLDEKIVLEGMATICLKTVVENGRYMFSTRNNGNDTVKTPMEMFETDTIDNDLAAVDAAICNYYGV